MRAAGTGGADRCEVNIVRAYVPIRVVARSRHEVDVAHRSLTDREVELAGERERARHARMLHDRVLQTLAGAAREALVNVLEHASTRNAVLHAELDMTTLTVSVLDQAAALTPGYGNRVSGSPPR